jgi:hypothetical protein
LTINVLTDEFTRTANLLAPNPSLSELAMPMPISSIAVNLFDGFYSTEIARLI